MNYKRIIATRNGNPTIFELEDGMFALVNHACKGCVQYSPFADTFLKFGYFDPPEALPAGTCDADIAYLLSLPEPDKNYGYPEEQLKLMLKRRDQLRQEWNVPPDKVI